MQPAAVCEGYVKGIISVLPHISIRLGQAGLRRGRLVPGEVRMGNRRVWRRKESNRRCGPPFSLPLFHRCPTKNTGGGSNSKRPALRISDRHNTGSQPVGRMLETVCEYPIVQ